MHPVLNYILTLLNLPDSQSFGNFVLSRGFHFSPTLHELVVYYLVKTILGLETPIDFIKYIDDLYKLQPHQFPIAELSIGLPGEGYFFTTREPNETEIIFTDDGYWRAVDEDADEEEYEAEQIEYKNHVIGFKKAYVFYQENEPTPWLLREYRFNSGLIPSNLLTDDLKTKMNTMIVCKIKDTDYEQRMYTPIRSEEEEED